MNDLNTIHFEHMTPAEFEQHLPEFFLAGGKVSEDPRLTKFLAANPDCAALVRDLEIIAETAKSLFEPTHEPSDAVWSNIASKLQEETPEDGGISDLAGWATVQSGQPQPLPVPRLATASLLSRSRCREGQPA